MAVVYRDEYLVAVHKPAGLLVHRTALDPRATRFALQIVRDQIGCHVDLVHRLDRGTSGLLLFAIDKAVGAALSGQFERGEVRKRYLAVVRGHTVPAGSIEHPLTRDVGAPQAALTHYRRLASVELPFAVDRYPSSRYSLLALLPVSGRRHQIRRHLKHIAHPVIGDATYGKGRHNRLFASLFGCQRMLLACVAMRVRHPRSGVVLDLHAAPAEDFAGVVSAAGLLPAGGLGAVLSLSEEGFQPAQEYGDGGLRDRSHHGQGRGEVG